MDHKEELREIIKILKKKTGKTQSELSLAAGYASQTLTQALSRDDKHEAVINHLKLVFKEILQNSTSEKSTKSPRHPKIESNPEKEGVLYVPISAQAGYSQKFLDPIYLNQLERVYMPGFPYRGDNFRIFEVAGDSMEPTLKEGYFVVGEKVEPDYWTTVADYYIYVIVTTDRCIVKRLVKRDDSFVAISDNEFHPQFVIKFEDIRELWYVKRKMDWEMPPPKRFEIKV